MSAGDVANLSRFRELGGGLLVTRDHQDLGVSLASLGAIGATQHFQSANPEPDPARRDVDDRDTPAITWPNYHSGANGDLQAIEVATPVHPLMQRSDGRPLQRLPSHPHEGAVCAEQAKVVACGRSRTTGRSFNLCGALDEPGKGRVVADSSFHHLCDYNWDPRMGCPSFVTEPPADAVLIEPDALADTHAYVANIAAWLARRI